MPMFGDVPRGTNTGGAPVGPEPLPAGVNLPVPGPDQLTQPYARRLAPQLGLAPPGGPPAATTGPPTMSPMAAESLRTVTPPNPPPVPPSDATAIKGGPGIITKDSQGRTASSGEIANIVG